MPSMPAATAIPPTSVPQQAASSASTPGGQGAGMMPPPANQGASDRAATAVRNEHGQFSSDSARETPEQERARLHAAYRTVKGLPAKEASAPTSAQDATQTSGTAGDKGNGGKAGKGTETPPDRRQRVITVEVARARLGREGVFDDDEIAKMSDDEAIKRANRIAKKQDADDEAHRAIRKAVPGWKPGHKPAPAGGKDSNTDAHGGSQPDPDSDVDDLMAGLTDDDEEPTPPAKGAKDTPRAAATRKAAQTLEVENFRLRVEHAALAIGDKFPALKGKEPPREFLENMGALVQTGQYDIRTDEGLARLVRASANATFADTIEANAQASLLQREQELLESNLNVGTRAESSDRQPTFEEKSKVAFQLAKKHGGNVQAAQNEMNAKFAR